jgi:CubicO group peptidase (beta-lactamase class C family)
MIGFTTLTLLGAPARADAAWNPVGLLQAAITRGAPPDLDAHIVRSMKAWGVAGLSIAIVKNDVIVMVRGYGVRDVRTGEPVDENTIFAIGSMTKAVTAIAAGRLVDQKKLDWDDLLSRHVPRFAVADAYVSGAATVRDALSHRTGFDWSIDALMITATSPREVIDALRLLSPVHPFRQAFNYSNILYIVGSEAVSAASGTTWERLIEQSIIGPLGLVRSTTGNRALEGMTNVATPHRNLGAGPQPIARGNTDVVVGAGAMSSSARDMARLVQMMARGGRLPNNDAFLSPATFDAILTPAINVGVEPEMRAFTNFHSYGLGWELMDYKGRKVAFHGGAIDGMLSQMAVVPGERLGVVVLTNTDGARYLPDALVLTVLDRYLGGTQTDWSAPFLKRGLAIRGVLYDTPQRHPNTRPTLPLASYAGVYSGPLGTIRVRLDADRLQYEYGVLKGSLEHWHYDTFRGYFGTYSNRLVTFALGAQGTPARLSIEFIGDFTRTQAGSR